MFLSKDSILLIRRSWERGSVPPFSRLTRRTVAAEEFKLSDSSSTWDPKLNRKEECIDCGSTASPPLPTAPDSASSHALLFSGLCCSLLGLLRIKSSPHFIFLPTDLTPDGESSTREEPISFFPSFSQFSPSLGSMLQLWAQPI